MLSYGRLVARAVIGGLSQTDGRDYSLVTASCGFGKDFRKGILKKGMCYGDDACFIARHKSADVLGESQTALCLFISCSALLRYECLTVMQYNECCFVKIRVKSKSSHSRSICHLQNYARPV